MKNRVVIIGCKGFVGGEIYKELLKNNFDVIGFSKNDIDLLKQSSVKKLNNKINDNDILIYVSAIAPCKNLQQFNDNLLMINNFINGVKDKKLKRLINISSDAVYADSLKKLNENSKTYPESFHGTMHLTRECLLRTIFGNLLTTIRPTLIYGVNDPHNGYGPNLFRRLLLANKNINLFGKGEELRDHISVIDLAKCIRLLIQKDKHGIYNAVSGQVISFYNIASYLMKIISPSNKIIFNQRLSPMPHNGYRAFRKSLIEKVIPDFKFSKIKSGLKVLNDQK